MREMTYLVGSVVVGLVVLVGFVLILYGFPPSAPSPDSCVALWNAPSNASTRARVRAQAYAKAEIEGVFEEGRYQGCSAWFIQTTEGPWTFYSATRIPGEDRPLRWTFGTHVRRWGSEFPNDPTPDLNATVLPDGSLSLRG